MFVGYYIPGDTVPQARYCIPGDTVPQANGHVSQTDIIHLSRIMGQQDNELSSYESPLGFSRSCYHTRRKIDSHSSKHHTTDVRAQIILINFPQIGQFWTFSH